MINPRVPAVAGWLRSPELPVPNSHWAACALPGGNCPVARLEEALAREEALIHEKDDAITRQALLSRESDHRLLNNMQMVASMLSLQGRISKNPEASAQLVAAAGRVAMVERVHRRLHSIDSVRIVDFRQYLEDICRDYAVLLSSEEKAGRAISVDAIELDVSVAAAVPLGFIVNELITNAAKYGNGRIAIRLELVGGGNCALTVSNDGPALAEGFDPNAREGLGMTLVQSFVKQIGGALRIERGDGYAGPQFTVLFSPRGRLAI